MLVFVRSNQCPSCGSQVFGASLFTVTPRGLGRRRLKQATTPWDSPGPSWVGSRHILITTQVGGGLEFAIISSQTGRVQRSIVPPSGTWGTQPPSDPPRLSPNRRQLAYTECDNGDCSSTSVDVITLTGGSVLSGPSVLGGRLIRRIHGASAPAWSPRGDLLYSCCGATNLRGNHNQIMLAPARGGAPHAVTPRSVPADQPEWLG
jgi:hypothetical protein